MWSLGMVTLFFSSWRMNGGGHAAFGMCLWLYMYLYIYLHTVVRYRGM